MLDKTTLFRIFAEKEDKFNIKVVDRYVKEKIIKYLGYKEILAITGVRRSGKTYVMYSLMQYLVKNNVPKENILYINFEDERLAFIEPKDLEKIYEWYLEFSKAEGKLYFFLDEIQNVKLWEKWLSRNFEKIKFVISGSNSNFLSSEIATAITGRSIEVSLFPFSFKEYIEYKDSKLIQKQDLAESKAKILSHFQDYLKLGGFPEVLLYNKKDILKEYYKTILLKDVISRYNIKYKDYLEQLSLYLMNNIGKTVSLYSLDKESPIGINTIKNYLNYIEKSFLHFFVNKFDFSIKKQHANPRKAYAADTALAREVSFRFTEDKGRILENVAFLELKKKGADIFYHKNRNECDFVIKKGIKITDCIQVCFELNTGSRDREISGLLEALDKYKLGKGLILTYDQEDSLNIEKRKVIIKPLWKWLLTFEQNKAA